MVVLPVKEHDPVARICSARNKKQLTQPDFNISRELQRVKVFCSYT
jgi:hypothetical protein